MVERSDYTAEGQHGPSSEYSRGFYQAWPGTITTSHDEVGKDASKFFKGGKVKICGTYLVCLRSKALRSGSAYTQTATIHADLRVILNIDYVEQIK